jgi:hypothetical protein
MKSFLREIYYRSVNQIKGGITKKICFIHTHKCGGTSINAAIRLNYINLDMRKDRNFITINSEASTKALNTCENSPHSVYRFREKLLIYFMNQKNTKYISGHFYFSDKAYNDFKDEYVFIIMLRNPIDRWISHYFFNRYKGTEFGKIESSIIECLNNDFGKHNGSEYVQFINGITESGDYFSEGAIEKAKINLHKFDIVGCLEYQKDFKSKFLDILGVNLNIELANKNPKSKSFQESFITSEIKEKISELCQPDLEVYRYAVKNFVRNYVD